jgi:hypothetical protein
VRKRFNFPLMLRGKTTMIRRFPVPIALGELLSLAKILCIVELTSNDFN